MAGLMEEDAGGMVLNASQLGGGAAEEMDEALTPDFPALTAADMGTGSNEYRRIRVPPHRLTPLRAEWAIIMQPMVEHLMLQIRYNPKMRAVELKTRYECYLDIQTQQQRIPANSVAQTIDRSKLQPYLLPRMLS